MNTLDTSLITSIKTWNSCDYSSDNSFCNYFGSSHETFFNAFFINASDTSLKPLLTLPQRYFLLLLRILPLALLQVLFTFLYLFRIPSRSFLLFRFILGNSFHDLQAAPNSHTPITDNLSLGLLHESGVPWKVYSRIQPYTLVQNKNKTQQ